jgi:hypothetical protein
MSGRHATSWDTMWLMLLNFPNGVQAPEGLPRLKSWVRIPFPAPRSYRRWPRWKKYTAFTAGLMSCCDTLVSLKT